MEGCTTSVDIQTAVRFDREISSPLMLGYMSHGSYDLQQQIIHCPCTRETSSPLGETAIEGEDEKYREVT